MFGADFLILLPLSAFNGVTPMTSGGPRWQCVCVWDESLADPGYRPALCSEMRLHFWRLWDVHLPKFPPGAASPLSIGPWPLPFLFHLFFFFYSLQSCPAPLAHQAGQWAFVVTVIKNVIVSFPRRNLSPRPKCSGISLFTGNKQKAEEENGGGGSIGPFSPGGGLIGLSDGIYTAPEKHC